MKYVVFVILGAFAVAFLGVFAISTAVGIIKYKRSVKKDEKADE